MDWRWPGCSDGRARCGRGWRCTRCWRGGCWWRYWFVVRSQMSVAWPIATPTRTTDNGQRTKRGAPAMHVTASPAPPQTAPVPWTWRDMLPAFLVYLAILGANYVL